MAEGHVSWDAKEYDVVADVQERWGRKLIERTAWRGDEAVLDAGCGSGRLFPHLLEKIPRGRLYAVDADPSMVEQARSRLERLDPAIPTAVRQCDLTQLNREVLGLDASSRGIDMVVSNAVFHWIRNKLALFSSLLGVLEVGGHLSAQFGGDKNLQHARAAAYRAGRELGLLEALHKAAERTVYVPVLETREQLKTCGFRNVRVWEHEEPTTFPDRDTFLRFCAAVIFAPLRPYLDDAQWQPFLDEFAAQAYGLFGEWKLDYVRQNIEAQR
jgi:trans-aconitate 2-methyltransferase